MTSDDRRPRRLTFHPDTGEYTTSLGEGSVVVAIVVSLAIVQGVDVTEIEPLERSVDTDLVESLGSNLSAGSITLDGRVAFEHDGHRIAIDGDRVLHVEPLQPG